MGRLFGTREYFSVDHQGGGRQKGAEMTPKLMQTNVLHSNCHLLQHTKYCKLGTIKRTPGGTQHVHIPGGKSDTSVKLN